MTVTCLHSMNAVSGAFQVVVYERVLNAKGRPCIRTVALNCNANGALSPQPEKLLKTGNDLAQADWLIQPQPDK